jgi:hypothetical protein
LARNIIPLPISLPCQPPQKGSSKVRVYGRIRVENARISPELGGTCLLLQTNNKQKGKGSTMPNFCHIQLEVLKETDKTQTTATLNRRLTT